METKTVSQNYSITYNYEDYPAWIVKDKIKRIDFNIFYMPQKSMGLMPIILIILSILFPLIIFIATGDIEIIILVIFVICFFIGIICAFTITTGKYLILEDNKIIVRKTSLCTKKPDTIYYTQEVKKAELIRSKNKDFEKIRTYHNYSISIITKEKIIALFFLSEYELLNLEGLNFLVNHINLFIQNKK